ncbi:unnamed protein product [Gadus morhua 'NCC']
MNVHYFPVARPKLLALAGGVLSAHPSSSLLSEGCCRPTPAPLYCQRGAVGPPQLLFGVHKRKPLFLHSRE